MGSTAGSGAIGTTIRSAGRSAGSPKSSSSMVGGGGTAICRLTTVTSAASSSSSGTTGSAGLSNSSLGSAVKFGCSSSIKGVPSFVQKRITSSSKRVSQVGQYFMSSGGMSI